MDLVNISIAATYLFIFISFIGILISIDNFKETQRNIRAIKKNIKLGNGRMIVANHLRRSSLFSIIQYTLLISIGVVAVIYTSVSAITFVGSMMRMAFALYAGILVTGDLMDMMDRRNIVYRRVEELKSRTRIR
jgi:hypothetical protein